MFRSLRNSRFQIVIIAGLTTLALATLTRLVLLVMGWSELVASPVSRVGGLLVGEVFDVLATMWLLAPLTLYLALLTERRFHGPVNRGFVRFLMFMGAYLGVFTFIAEILFFDEFSGRFNFVAVDYLIFPTEVTVNLWESYPLAWILGGILVASAVYVYAIRRKLRAALKTVTPWRMRLGVLGGYAVVLAGLTLSISPPMARVSDDRTMNEIALNGYYTFWEAFLGQDAPYEGLYAVDSVKAEDARLPRLLEEPQLVAGSLDPLSTLRRVAPAGPTRRLNVVVVLEESLGSMLVGSLHPRDTSLTPRFDSLVTEGTLLANNYSTGNRTIRALEATTASIPPLPGISIVRRPASRDLFTLPEVLRAHGYNTEFIYGGRALFDGMAAYMRGNGMERIVEQKDFPDSDFTTAWGVADEYIFNKALTELDSLSGTGKPFYSLILSVSNHKPYSFPEGRIAADPHARRRENAVMYADYALGRFVRQARSHPWFDSTLFVLMGDHGARVYGASEIPLPSYEVPVLFYAPALIPAGVRVQTLTSSMDVPPTILAQLGISYETLFFGRDVFNLPPSDGRALMTHNNEIALMRGDDVAVLGLQGATDVYRYDKSEGRLRLVETPDSAQRDLLHDAIAYYHAADRLYRSGHYLYSWPELVARRNATTQPTGSR